MSKLVIPKRNNRWSRYCKGIDHFYDRLQAKQLDFLINPYREQTPEYTGYDYARRYFLVFGIERMEK